MLSEVFSMVCQITVSGQTIFRGFLQLLLRHLTKKAQGESGWDVQDDVDRMLLRTVVTARTVAADSFVLRV